MSLESGSRSRRWWRGGSTRSPLIGENIREWLWDSPVFENPLGGSFRNRQPRTSPLLGNPPILSEFPVRGHTDYSTLVLYKLEPTPKPFDRLSAQVRRFRLGEPEVGAQRLYYAELVHCSHPPTIGERGHVLLGGDSLYRRVQVGHWTSLTGFALAV